MLTSCTLSLFQARTALHFCSARSELAQVSLCLTLSALIVCGRLNATLKLLDAGSEHLLNFAKPALSFETLNSTLGAACQLAT